jgi:hypothetical protein
VSQASRRVEAQLGNREDLSRIVQEVVEGLGLSEV